MTQPDSWMSNPEAFTTAARDTAAATVGGLIDLQRELHQAAETSWAQGKKELERLSTAQDKAFRDGLAAQNQAMEKALGWWKEQIERTGAAPAAEA